MKGITLNHQLSMILRHRLRTKVGKLRRLTTWPHFSEKKKLAGKQAENVLQLYDVPRMRRFINTLRNQQQELTPIQALKIVNLEFRFSLDPDEMDEIAPDEDYDELIATAHELHKSNITHLVPENRSSEVLMWDFFYDEIREIYDYWPPVFFDLESFD